MIEGVAITCASLAKVLSGALADFVPKSRLIAAGTLVSAAVKLLFAQATRWVLARSTDFLGRMSCQCMSHTRHPERAAPRRAVPSA